MEDKTCWDCGHMRRTSEFDDEFYCNKLNRWFKKQTEDEKCEDFEQDFGKPLEVRK